ncbi:MAG TPA: hypothetical protein VM910_30675, partial [Bradyrhizobium sp.]|nr:hypothetical protein [Bradyrhizobium sp.]
PASMASESKGRLAGFMMSRFQASGRDEGRFTRMSAMNLESARLHATCLIRIGQIAIDAAGA